MTTAKKSRYSCRQSSDISNDNHDIISLCRKKVQNFKDKQEKKEIQEKNYYPMRNLNSSAVFTVKGLYAHCLYDNYLMIDKKKQYFKKRDSIVQCLNEAISQKLTVKTGQNTQTIIEDNNINQNDDLSFKDKRISNYTSGVTPIDTTMQDDNKNSEVNHAAKRPSKFIERYSGASGATANHQLKKIHKKQNSFMNNPHQIYSVNFMD